MSICEDLLVKRFLGRLNKHLRKPDEADGL